MLARAACGTPYLWPHRPQLAILCSPHGMPPLRSSDQGSCELHSVLRIAGPYEGWTQDSIQGSYYGPYQSPYIGTMSFRLTRHVALSSCGAPQFLSCPVQAALWDRALALFAGAQADEAPGALVCVL